MTKLKYILVITGLCVSTFVSADPPAANNSQPSQTEIASKIHSINQMEVKVGQLAMSRGTTPQIRRYGDRLVRDHQLADRMILGFSKDQGLALGTLPSDPAEQAAMTQLESSHGAAFDQQFLTMMDQGHMQAISFLTQQQSNLPEGSELRGLVTKLLPILKQHDQLAENLQKGKIGG